MARFSFHRFSRAFSLLEVLIAFSLLVVAALGVISIFRQSGVRGEAFSSEHFTAMFLAQKVLEDISAQVSENPHSFTDLIHGASGDKKSIINGGSPYFKLLENTANFNSLSEGEDQAITLDSGSLYNQLKNFACQVETRFVTDKVTGQPIANLIEVVVNISWKDVGGIQQTYSISQYLSGFNEDQFAITVAQVFPVSEDQAALSLWGWTSPGAAPTTGTFDSFMAANGGNRDIVLAIGRLSYLLDEGMGTTKVYNDKVDSYILLRNAALAGSDPATKKKAVSYQEKIAQSYEKKATQLFNLMSQAKPSVDYLKSQVMTDANLGSLLKSKKDPLKGLFQDCSLIIDQIPLNFAGAADEYDDLFKSPYRELLSARKVTPNVRRLIDIEKIGVLYQSYWIPGSSDVSSLRARIQEFRDKYQGKEPIFLRYLEREAAICATISSIRQYFGGSAGFAAFVDQVIDCKQNLLDLEDQVQ